MPLLPLEERDAQGKDRETEVALFLRNTEPIPLFYLSPFVPGIKPTHRCREMMSFSTMKPPELRKGEKNKTKPPCPFHLLILALFPHLHMPDKLQAAAFYFFFFCRNRENRK